MAVIKTPASADGSIIVGSGNDASDQTRVLRWENGEVSEVPELRDKSARGLSRDGKVIAYGAGA